ncbi:MAG: TatD family hydrolase [Fibrobacterota bacterium]
MIQGGVRSRDMRAVGIHPWYAHKKEYCRTRLEMLDGLLRDSPNLQIGECGLDLVHSRSNTEQQYSLFREHLLRGVRHRRILMVHLVKGWDLFFSLLDSFGGDLPTMILHDFSGSPELVERCLKYPVCFSFGRGCLSQRFKKKRAALITVPSDRLFLESDAETAEAGRWPQLLQLYQEAARLRNSSPGALSRQCRENWESLFGEF